jgi:hypothetical protein
VVLLCSMCRPEHTTVHKDSKGLFKLLRACVECHTSSTCHCTVSPCKHTHKHTQ